MGGPSALFGPKQMKTRILEHSRHQRLFCCLMSLLLAVGVARQVQAVTTTTVQDVVYRADGQPAKGTLVISWPAFTTAANLAVAAGSMSVAIGPQGAISIALLPNAGGTPEGTYYKVVYKLDDGSTSEEYWSVPATSTTTIAAVRSKIVPSGVAMQVASRQYVDSAIAAAFAGDHSPFPRVVTSFSGRTGDVMPVDKDYAYSQLKNIPSSFNAGQLQGKNLDAPTVAGQQPTYDGAKFVEQAKQASDFRDFGANGDLIADDTSAANSAIVALASNGGSIQLPGSTNFFWMKLSAPLNLSNTGNYKIAGAADSTGFTYCGNGSGPVVNANNSFNLGLQDLAIYGHWRDNCSSTYATAGIAWDKTGTGAWSATRLMVNRVTITAAPQGDISTPNFTCVDISPTSQVKVEDGKFYNITCNPSGGIGFHIGPSPNAKNEIFFNNNVSFGQYGYKFDGGSYHIKYGEVGNLTESALWLGGASHPVSVDGLLSAANKQFLTLGPSFGHQPITLSHIDNGWDNLATAPCYWDLGGAQYFLAFSNTWWDTSSATPYALCGNSSSAGMFLNNSFAWKVGGASAGYYDMLPPPATIQQLLGPSYGFYHGGNIVVGSVNPNTDNGLSFLQSTGGTRHGLRILETSTPRTDGAIPVASDNPYLGDGVVEVAGPGAATVLPGCTVTGGDTSQSYAFWMFAKDADGKRTTEAHTFCSGPATLDSTHQMTFQWVGTPGSLSYDTMFLVNGQSCFIGNTGATSITVSAMPACDNAYLRPTQNEAEYVKLRGKGVYGYGPTSPASPSWWIDNAAGVASFSGGVSAPNLAPLCTASNAQTCINALAATGGTVYLGAGTYTGTITLPDNGNCVNLVGAGIDQTVLTVSSSASAVVTKANSSLPLGCRITDLTIDGSLQATYGLRLQKGKGWQIQRVKVKRVLAATGEGVVLGESSGTNAEFYEARIRDLTIAFESGDYTSNARPLNGLHLLTTATDNFVSDVTAWNMSGAGVVDDGGDNQFDKIHVYGFPLLTYYPNYAMEVLGNAHITHLTADGVNSGGVHVRGNGNSVTNSTFQWPSGGQVSGAFPVVADAGTDYNVYRDNVVRSASGLVISSVGAIFAKVGASYFPGNNTEIAGNVNYNDPTDGAFVAFYPVGFQVTGAVTPNAGYTFVTPFNSKPTIAVRKKSGQTADLFDCFDTDGASKLCSVDGAGNAVFAGVTAPLIGNASTATALAAIGTECSSGQAARGVDASGNAVGCFAPSGTANATSIQGKAVDSGVASASAGQVVGVVAPDGASIRAQTKQPLDTRDDPGSTLDARISGRIAAAGSSGAAIQAEAGTWTANPAWGSYPVHLILMPGTTFINTSLNIPCNVTLEHRQGAILKPASGTTVTICNPPVATSMQQIFDISAGGWIVPSRGTIYVPWYGVDCSETTDSSSILNAMTGTIDRLSYRTVEQPAVCQIRVDDIWDSFGQESLTWRGAGPNSGNGGGARITGCNGPAGGGPVLRINRSGYNLFENLVIQSKGSSCSSNFTGAIETLNSGSSGYTSTHNKFRSLFLTTNVNGQQISNWYGVRIEGTPNQEMYGFEDLIIQGQNSANSECFWQNDGNADSTSIKGTRTEFHGCYHGIRVDGGSVSIEDANLTGNGRYSLFGSGGAAIYENGGCVGSIVRLVMGDGSGQFIKNSHYQNRTCSHYIWGIQANPDDVDPAVYHLEAPGGTQVLGSNAFAIGAYRTLHNNTIMGYDGDAYGPNGTVIDLGGNNLTANNGSSYQLTNQPWKGSNLRQSAYGPTAEVNSQNPGGWALKTSTGLPIPGLGLNNTQSNGVFNAAVDHMLLGDGIMEFTGMPGAFADPITYNISDCGSGCSQQLILRLYPKDAAGNRSTPTVEQVVYAPNTLDGSHYVTVNLTYPVPGASSYDVVCRSGSGGSGAVATGVSLPYTITANPTCSGYTPSTGAGNLNESAGIIWRTVQGQKFHWGSGTLTGYSDGGSTTKWSINGATGVASFTGGVTAALAGNASTATALASTPTQCSTHNFATGIAASGNANCAQPAAADINGLGGAATLNVGTTSGTVAAGDDSRFNCDVTKNPCRVAATSLTGQTASIGNTTLYTPSAAGQYRVVLSLWTMVAGSSGTVSLSLSANTGSGAESFGSSSLDLTKVNSGGQVSGQWNMHVGANQAISYNTTLTCSSCGSPQYGIDVVVERLQ